MDKDTSGESAGRPRAPRDPGAPDLAQPTPAPARTVQLISGDLLLTVNPVDGSEIEPRPPGGAPEGQDWPPEPRRRTHAQRAEAERAAKPPVPAGPAAPRLPLLERDEVHERVTRLLSRGRSVRLTGPDGSGRTTLLDLVAEDCAGLAPDGVVRLNGLHRTANELLYDLFAALHSAPRYRPGRAELLARVREIGAVVVLDDLAFGGSALNDLLAAAPECAFLLSAAPGLPEPAPGARLDEVSLTGLSRGASLELLERVVDRPLTEDETNWAGDLWFESQGLPLRFVQAGALLRQCDELRDDPDAFEDLSPFEGARSTEVPLPTLGQGAAPAALLASRLSAAARETLRFAVALGGEVPHQAHLPALVGDTHADAALGELLGCGLLSPAGARYRLSPGAVTQLREKGYGDDSAETATHARTAARHYAWWAAHPSVAPERVAAEADAVVAALAALVAQGKRAGHASAAVLLARGAAPALAAGLHWGAWERVLRIGSEAARIAGEVAEEAYFHHELGALALCTGNLDRARAELETSVGMRGALSDKKGTVASRRALALVTDHFRGGAASAPTVPTAPGAASGGSGGAGGTVPDVRPEKSPEPVTGAVPAVAGQGFGALPPGEGAGGPVGEHSGEAEPLVSRDGPYGPGTYDDSYAGSYGDSYDDSYDDGAPDRRRRIFLGGARRNLVAAGAGALLAAVLGTVATLGAVSDERDAPGGRVGTEQSASEDTGGDGLEADTPAAGEPPPATPAQVPARSGSSSPPRFLPPAVSSTQRDVKPPRPPRPGGGPVKPPSTKPGQSTPAPTKSPKPSVSASPPGSTSPSPSDSSSAPTSVSAPVGGGSEPASQEPPAN
ncbi:ATP-binding protein [Streptomyces sp. NPDC051018]|uniref:ATP-binding protein n=1 Tax=Streptomyces sp. NPDC051018 TaxID=3365639 RepID=UPI00378B194B